MAQSLEQQIKSKAIEIGFDACGITDSATFDKESLSLDNWIANNYHANMDFITRHRDKRKNPHLLHENTQSIIVVLLNYGNPTYFTHKKSDYSLVEYALGEDYHIVLKEKLRLLTDYLSKIFPESHHRCFVDSAPIFEKALAVKAGLGWIGKNTLLVTKKGSTFFIGEIFTDIPLKSDSPQKESHCGSCNKCIEACPTNALEKPYLLNANQCLSYHSIERKQVAWETDIKNYKSKYIYGCDLCQRACPYNEHRTPNTTPELKIKKEILNYSNSEWEMLSEKAFNHIFKNSAVKRIGYQNFKENIRMAKGDY